MKAYEVVLNSNIDVKDFVNIASKFSFDIDLVSGRYVVDGKSIMGVFSLDLSKAIKVEVHADDCAEFEKEIQRFIK